MIKKTRAAVAAMIVITALLITSIPVFAFSENESRSVQDFFVETQLLKGDGKGYGLEKTASRLEGVIILIRLMGKEAEALSMSGLPCQFTDVPDWAKGYVNYAYAENISKGVSGTRFGISDRITAYQYNTLLLRVLGYDDSKGDFQWNASVEKAEELTILPPDMADTYARGGTYTKGDLMKTSFCYLEARYKEQDHSIIDVLLDSGVISEQLAEEYGLGIDGWYELTTGYDADDYLTFSISGSTLTITGTSEDKNKAYLLVRVNDTDTAVKKADAAGTIGSDGQYHIELSLGRLPAGEYYVDVFGNDERYHSYTSTVLSSVIIKKTPDDLIFKAAPVYGQNLRIHKSNQIEDSDYKMTFHTRAAKEFITAVSDLSDKITAGISNDYDKVQAIHDWVANEIYYDQDYLSGKAKVTNINSFSVLKNKYAVCSGYANLTNDLLAAAGIPSRQVFGYALGITSDSRWEAMNLRELEPNHVWNEVYVDGRWIVVDVTWDSKNDYEGGRFEKGEGVSQLYFNVAMPFFSNTHRAMEL